MIESIIGNVVDDIDHLESEVHPSLFPSKKARTKKALKPHYMTIKILMQKCDFQFLFRLKVESEIH